VPDIYLGMQPATQVNSAWPSHRGQAQKSTRQMVVTSCGWGVKAGMVRVWVASNCVIPSLHTAISEHFRDAKALYRCTFTLLYFNLLCIQTTKQPIQLDTGVMHSCELRPAISWRSGFCSRIHNSVQCLPFWKIEQFWTSDCHRSLTNVSAEFRIYTEIN